MKTEIIDGMDVYAVKDTATKLIDQVRSGKGPVLLECNTYRYYGHSKSDTRPYRTREEEAEWRERDCIDRLAKRLIDARSDYSSPGRNDARGSAQANRGLPQLGQRLRENQPRGSREVRICVMG